MHRQSKSAGPLPPIVGGADEIRRHARALPRDRLRVRCRPAPERVAYCRRRAVQISCVPPPTGAVIWKVPPLFSARRRMLARPLDLAGVPRPRPLSVMSRVISPSCRARAMVTAVARAWRAQLDGLPGHGALHAVGQLDVLELYQGHLYAPVGGGDVEDPADVEVDPVGLGQRLVQGVLPHDLAQRGLRDLVDRGAHVLNRDDRLHRVDHPEVGDRGHVDADVVPGVGSWDQRPYDAWRNYD